MEDDLAQVPKAQLRKCLRQLEANPEKGKPLGGTLKGLRSTHVGSDNRLVYRLISDKDETVVDVIAIGRRRDDQVYEEVKGRL